MMLISSGGHFGILRGEGRGSKLVCNTSKRITMRVINIFMLTILSGVYLSFLMLVARASEG